MSEQEPNDSNDRAIGALYRRARHGEPSADLDRRILEAARRMARRRRNRWLVPLSTAATLLIGITLLVKVTDHGQYAPERAILSEEPAPMQRNLDAAGAPPPEHRAEERAPMLKSRPAPQADTFNNFRAPPPSSEVMQNAAPLSESGSAEKRDPAAWIAAIEHLFERGETEQAQAELNRFREQYPDHPLPDRLRVRE